MEASGAGFYCRRSLDLVAPLGRLVVSGVGHV
jgi:hypothetical protein